MQTQPTERLTYTVEEACDRLGIGRTLGYELARRGELPGVIRLGRRLLVSRPALEQALDARTLRAPTNSAAGSSPAALEEGR